jgi:hypothetical protein
MRELREVLQDGFEAHVGALGRAGASWAGLAELTVRDTRSRRAWRAGAASAAAAAAVVGIVATAVAVGGGGALNPAQRLVMENPDSLGECTAYMPANVAVFPEGWYVGRAYVDSASDFVVAVTPDGTVTRVQPDANGDYFFDFGKGSPRHLWGSGMPDDMPPLINDETVSGGGGDMWVDAGLDSYAWTRVVSARAPDGVNVNNLWKTLAITLTGGGQGYDPSAVPRDATTDFVAGYSDGHEDAGTMTSGAPTPSVKEDIDTNGLDYVALRVTLADGETWDLRFDYTPENIPDLPCQPTPPSGPLEAPSETPTAPAEPGVSQGPATDESQAVGKPLSGPESEIFQCEAPLPAELQDTADVTARVASGEVMISEPYAFDAGEDGLVIDVTSPMWEVDELIVMDTPRVVGWLPNVGSQNGGPVLGNLSMVQVVAVAGGAIVGFAGEPVDDWTAGGVGGSNLSYRTTDQVDHTGGFITTYNGIHGLLEPCAGILSADLDDAQLAVLYGFGPNATDVTYGWTLVSDG